MRRTDVLGRAFAGSQLQVQIYVNRRQRELSRAVSAALPDVVGLDPWLYWVSPLEASGFREYRDEGFLRAVGLAHLEPQLAQFWPRRGPVWDALGVVEHSSGRGVVLVEAKSHAGELYGSGCRAGSDSRSRIETALDEAKSALGAARDADWTGPLYQYANRLAHLYFLRREGVAAWFVHLLFLDDPISPTHEATWRDVLFEAHRELGLQEELPHTAFVLLQARPPSELHEAAPMLGIGSSTGGAATA